MKEIRSGALVSLALVVGLTFVFGCSKQESDKLFRHYVKTYRYSARKESNLTIQQALKKAYPALKAEDIYKRFSFGRVDDMIRARFEGPDGKVASWNIDVLAGSIWRPLNDFAQELFKTATGQPYLADPLDELSSEEIGKRMTKALQSRIPREGQKDLKIEYSSVKGILFTMEEAAPLKQKLCDSIDGVLVEFQPKFEWKKWCDERLKLAIRQVLPRSWEGERTVAQEMYEALSFDPYPWWPSVAEIAFKPVYGSDHKIHHWRLQVAFQNEGGY